MRIYLYNVHDTPLVVLSLYWDGICRKGREWILKELDKKCEDVWNCLDWENLDWICKDNLLEFVSDRLVGKEFWNYFKSIRCKCTNLPLLLKSIWIMNYDIEAQFPI